MTSCCISTLCDAPVFVVDGDEQREANAITGISDDESGVPSNESTSRNEPGPTTEHMNRNKSVVAEGPKYFKRLAVSAHCTGLACHLAHAHPSNR